eukprot:CAMPEP_0115174470 /NCGR_PEP_ID=MMETSP0270-20121206/3854_1 /TAXON_ID=71861 /ORGANISM="Scrippsiella trochoidea, Strain CCMP3099" /LENGTH=301 /DNA_ID=CAMNT_0002587307 /DNA_START=287 /DNA_END=1188 /DNA_ORIENTATION=+
MPAHQTAFLEPDLAAGSEDCSGWELPSLPLGSNAVEFAIHTPVGGSPRDLTSAEERIGSCGASPALVECQESVTSNTPTDSRPAENLLQEACTDDEAGDMNSPSRALLAPSVVPGEVALGTPAVEPARMDDTAAQGMGRVQGGGSQDLADSDKVLLILAAFDFDGDGRLNFTECNALQQAVGSASLEADAFAALCVELGIDVDLGLGSAELAAMYARYGTLDRDFAAALLRLQDVAADLGDAPSAGGGSSDGSWGPTLLPLLVSLPMAAAVPVLGMPLALMAVEAPLGLIDALTGRGKQMQ